MGLNLGDSRLASPTTRCKFLSSVRALCLTRALIFVAADDVIIRQCYIQLHNRIDYAPQQTTA